MSLKNNVFSLMDQIEEVSSGYKELTELKSCIGELRNRLNEPLRVAVIGLLKAGKSTLINAILRKQILITGSLETTYTVTWFRYGSQPGIVIHYRNGAVSSAPVTNISDWTARQTMESGRNIDDVEYVEIYDDNPLLQKIEIIDTPGLESTYGVDSENTVDFLEASKADAIIYGFSKGFAESDDEALTTFLNSLSNASPINAFGVLTRVDSYWKDDESPFDKANIIVERYKTDPYIRSRLYTVVAVSSKTSGCCAEIEAEDYGILQRLADLDPLRLRNLLNRAEKFCMRDYDDVPVNSALRNRMYEKFDLYGTYLAVEAVRNGMPREKLAEYLLESSGIRGVTRMIEEHFGRRAEIIKLNYIIGRIKDKCRQILNASFGNKIISEVLLYTLDELQKIEENEQLLSNLQMLQFYYNRQLELNDAEQREFFNLMGENGSEVEDKLVCGGLSVRKMAELAQQKADYWYERANLRYGSRMYIEMCRNLGRTCEKIRYYLSGAEV